MKTKNCKRNNLKIMRFRLQQTFTHLCQLFACSAWDMK